MAVSKKEQISQGALQAFAQYGYSETTMDTIAEVANVAKGTLYYHFKTKEELFLYVNQKGVKMLIDVVTSAMQDKSRSLRERMLSVLDEHIRFFSEHSEFCLLLLSFTSGDQNRDKIIHSVIGDYFATMETYWKELQDQGVINPKLDVQTLVSALFGMVGITVLRKILRQEPITEETKLTLIALCEGALGVQQVKDREETV